MIEYLRNFSIFYLMIQIKTTERHAAQAPALRERLPQIVNIQSSIFNCKGEATSTNRQS